jgi:DNA-binding NarL/FixJ family response regulator
MDVLAAHVAARGSVSDAAEPGETCRPRRASRGPGQLGLSPTHRQLEVLLARCETGSRKGAARLLGIQTKTVHWHFARLFDRCGCVDEAMAAFRHSDELELVRAAAGRGTIWRVVLPPPTITGTMER